MRRERRPRARKGSADEFRGGGHAGVECWERNSDVREEGGDFWDVLPLPHPVCMKRIPRVRRIRSRRALWQASRMRSNR